MVVDIENKVVKEKRMLPKMGCNHGGYNGEHQGPKGDGAEPDSNHDRMADPIGDCEALICGGMSFGVYQSLMLRRIRTIITEIGPIDDALKAYLEGSIDDHPELLH